MSKNLKFQKFRRFCGSMVVILAFSACSKYSYITITSDLPKTQAGESVLSTDTVLISYRFVGEDAKMAIRIENRTDKPLFLNWSHSSLIRNGQSVSLGDKKEEVDRQAKYRRSGTFNRAIAFPGEVSLIPPKAYIDSKPVAIGTIFPENEHALPCNAFKSARCAEYTRESSPMQIRSYLVLSRRADLKNSFAIDQHFWISALQVGSLPPRDYQAVGGNEFVAYSHKFTGFGKVATGVFVLGTLTLAAYIHDRGRE